jgi:hypothetical protein
MPGQRRSIRPFPDIEIPKKMSNQKLLRNLFIGSLILIPLAMAFPHGPFPALAGFIGFVITFIPIQKLK